MRLSSLFGPLALIIGKQIEDTLKFLVLLALFLFGFTMLTMALNEPLVFDEKDKVAINSFSRKATTEEELEDEETSLKKGINSVKFLKMFFMKFIDMIILLKNLFKNVAFLFYVQKRLLMMF